MECCLTDRQHYADIADALRRKTGRDESYAPSEMASAILELPSPGGDLPYVEETIDEDGNLIGVSLHGYVETRPGQFKPYMGDNKTLQYAEMSEPLHTISNYTFDHCIGMSNVVLPDGLEVIGEEAFSCCFGLKTINIPSSIRVIDACAFNWCESLHMPALPDGLEKIGYYAIYGCAETDIDHIPYSVTFLDEGALEYLVGITHLTIYCNPKLEICGDAFGELFDLTEVVFVGKPAVMGSEWYDHFHQEIFYYCDNLTSIKVPWSEGEFPGAPWGATNATITYNYTEGA